MPRLNPLQLATLERCGHVVHLDPSCYTRDAESGIVCISFAGAFKLTAEDLASWAILLEDANKALTPENVHQTLVLILAEANKAHDEAISAGQEPYKALLARIAVLNKYVD